MASRPVRQFYGEQAPIQVSGSADDVVEPWRRHRERFVTVLAGLDQDDWYATTRCDDWDVRQVLNHLATADAFWMASLNGAATGEPTTFLDGFDPGSTPNQVIASLEEDPPDVVLDRFEEATAAFIATAESLDTEHWSETAESPLGHVTARLALAHAHWDSWLHERDILLPLGEVPEEHLDEILIAAWYSLAAAGLQGGLVDDWGPALDGPSEPIEATLRFDDLPGTSLSLRVTDHVDVRIDDPDDSGRATDAGRAVEFVDAFTGRRTIEDSPVAADLREHITRAGQIL